MKKKGSSRFQQSSIGQPSSFSTYSKRCFSASLMLAAAAVVSFAPQLSAQTIDDIIPDFSPEQSKILSNGFGIYTSALTVFTSRKGLGRLIPFL
jgi:hypothetical protein